MLSINVACLRMCFLLYFYFACLHVCAYAFKFIHCASVLKVNKMKRKTSSCFGCVAVVHVRVYGCVFCSLPLLFVYLRMRLSSNPRSIAGVLFDLVGSLRITFVLGTTCMHQPPIPSPPPMPKTVALAKPENCRKFDTKIPKQVVSAERLKMIRFKYPNSPNASSGIPTTRPRAHFLVHHLSLCNK